MAAKRCDAGKVLAAEKHKEAKKIENSQLQRIHRKRKSLEASVGLPPRGQRGATPEYKKALSEWQRINRRPTREEMVAGWVPKPLPEPFPPQVGKQTTEEKAKEDAVCQKTLGKIPVKTKIVDVEQKKNATGMEGHQDGQLDRGKAPDCEAEYTQRFKGETSPKPLGESLEPTLQRQKKIEVLERMKTKLILP